MISTCDCLTRAHCFLACDTMMWFIQDAWMVGSGAAIVADLLAVSVLISITRQLWDTRVAKKAKRTLQVSEYAHLKM